MSALTVQLEQHPRFSGGIIPTEVAVSVDEDYGTSVVLNIEAGHHETISGLGDAPTAAVSDIATDLLRSRFYLETGETMDRSLTPEEARALAAALVHFADVAERNRR